MDKVKVSKEVDGAIREAKAWYGSEYYKCVLLGIKHNCTFHHSELDLSPLKELTFDDLAKALYVGYKVKGMKEQELLRYYDSFKGDLDSDIALKVIEDVVDILGVKVEGINK